eukprot:3232683-Rhodomonas_salina.1
MWGVPLLGVIPEDPGHVPISLCTAHVSSATSLCPAYANSATSLCTACANSAISLRTAYAESGTDRRYAATSPLPHLHALVREAPQSPYPLFVPLASLYGPHCPICTRNAVPVASSGRFVLGTQYQSHATLSDVSPKRSAALGRRASGERKGEGGQSE